MELNDSQSQKPNNSQQKHNKKRYVNHNIRKRPAPKLPKRENDVYVNNHSNLQVSNGIETTLG